MLRHEKTQQLGLEEPRIRFTGSEKIVQLPVYDLADKGDSTCPTIGIPDIPHVPALKKEVIFSGEIPKLCFFLPLTDFRFNLFNFICQYPSSYAVFLLGVFH